LINRARHLSYHANMLVPVYPLL